MSMLWTHLCEQLVFLPYKLLSNIFFSRCFSHVQPTHCGWTVSLSLKKALFKNCLRYLLICQPARLSVSTVTHTVHDINAGQYLSHGHFHSHRGGNTGANNEFSSNGRAILHLEFNKIWFFCLPFKATQHIEFIFHFMFTHVSFETKIPVYLQLFNQFLWVCIQRALKTQGFHLAATKLVLQGLKH